MLSGFGDGVHGTDLSKGCAAAAVNRPSQMILVCATTAACTCQDHLEGSSNITSCGAPDKRPCNALISHRSMAKQRPAAPAAGSVCPKAVFAALKTRGALPSAWEASAATPAPTCNVRSGHQMLVSTVRRSVTESEDLPEGAFLAVNNRPCEDTYASRVVKVLLSLRCAHGAPTSMSRVRF